MFFIIVLFNSGPGHRYPSNRPGKAAPDPPDIVEESQEIVDFQSRGGGPVGHPQGVQGKTLISGPDFGRTATGKAPVSALRPTEGRPEGRFRGFPGSGYGPGRRFTARRHGIYPGRCCTRVHWEISVDRYTATETRSVAGFWKLLKNKK